MTRKYKKKQITEKQNRVKVKSSKIAHLLNIPDRHEFGREQAQLSTVRMFKIEIV